MFQFFKFFLLSLFITVNSVQAEILNEDVLGDYQLKVKFGDRIFEDRMTVEKVGVNENHPHVIDIAGTFTVPGAFSVPFTGVLCPHDPEDRTRCPSYYRGYLRVEFTVDEGNGPFDVKIEGMVIANHSPANVYLRLYIDGEHLGTATEISVPYYPTRSPE